MSGGGEVKRKGGGYVSGGEKKGKKKEKREKKMWYVGGWKKKKKGRGENIERNRGREWRKMGKECILEVVKKIKNILKSGIIKLK